MDLNALSAYDLPTPVEPFSLPSGANNRVVGVRAGGGVYVLKHYQAHADPAMLAGEHRLLLAVARRGLPFAVPAPTPTRDGATLVSGPSGTFALFPQIAGEHPAHYGPAHLEAAGAALAQLHQALAALPPSACPPTPGFDALDQVHPSVPAPGALTPASLGLPDTAAERALLAAWYAGLAELRPFLAGPYLRLPEQIVHGDYCCANLLWRGVEVVAVIDFEFACRAVRALDLASLIDLHARVWARPADWAGIAAGLRGYGRHTRLRDDEAAALPALMHLRNAVSTIWWTGRSLREGRPVELDRFRRGLAVRDWCAREGARLVELASSHQPER